MNKEEMLNNLMRQRGLEDELVIWFCELEDKLSTEQLYIAYLLINKIEED